MDSNINKPLIIIISSPSGAGKSSICRNLLNLDSNIKLSVSVTTRKARDNETSGKDYHFVSSDEFRSLMNENKLLEYAKVFNNYYGSLREQVDTHLANGNDVLFDIDWQGAQQIVNSDYFRIITIFIMPPSKESIEQRLLTRQKDSGDNIRTVKDRMLEYETEISHQDEYKYIVVNDNLEKCTDEIIRIIKNERK
jgi:guanylate kinase